MPTKRSDIHETGGIPFRTIRSGATNGSRTFRDSAHPYPREGEVGRGTWIPDAARALDDDWPQVLAALRRGLADKDAGKAARTAIAYVQLVYGRQLQQPADESSSVDPLDVASMSREERNRWKARILSQHPELVAELEADL